MPLHHEFPDVQGGCHSDLPTYPAHPIVVIGITSHLRRWHRNERRAVKPLGIDRRRQFLGAPLNRGRFVVVSTGASLFLQIGDQAVGGAERVILPQVYSYKKKHSSSAESRV